MPSSTRSWPSPLTKVRSIFTMSIGNDCRRDSDEKPVPKSSTETRTPLRDSMPSSSDARTGSDTIEEGPFGATTWYLVLAERIDPEIYHAFMDAGFVFVSINHRLLPAVDMGAITRDVASALGWVHKNIAARGGDPARLLVMGHSSGGQLAALMCTDDRYLKAEGVSLTAIKGCVPVDADTFDIPAIIEVAETRARAHHFPLPTNGHRQKFGNDPEKHRDFSAVTHVAKDKNIPPFLILHIAGHPDTTAQARRMAAVLQGAGISVKVVAGRETTHASINDNLGTATDPVTKELFTFVADVLKR